MMMSVGYLTTLSQILWLCNVKIRYGRRLVTYEQEPNVTFECLDLVALYSGDPWSDPWPGR
jgi:hypothetical protein